MKLCVERKCSELKKYIQEIFFCQAKYPGNIKISKLYLRKYSF